MRECLRKLFGLLDKTAKVAAGFLIAFYRAAISPLTGPSCRFYPSCSSYAQQALEKKNAFVALGMIVKRLLKCHPFHPGGVDVVK